MFLKRFFQSLLNFWSFLKRYNIDVLLFYCLLVFVFFFFVGDHVIGSADTYNQYLPLRVFYSQALKNGEFPLWYPYQALGLPFLGIVQGGGLYPFNLLIYKFFDPYWAYNFGIYFHSVLAQFGAFLYSLYVYKKIGLDRLLAVLSGFIFGLSGFVVSHIDFVPLQNSVAYIPWSMLFLNILIDGWRDGGIKRNWGWVLGLSICMGYQFLAGYPQAFIYTFIFLFMFALFNGYRFVGLVFLALVSSFPIIFIFAYEAFSLSSLSVRNYINFETYNQGSLPLYGLWSMVIPFIFGGSVSNPYYWGPATGTISFEFLGYISIVALPLTVLGYFKIFRDEKLRKNLWIMGSLGLLSLVLAMGKYNLVLHYLLFDLPFYSKVRIVARHLMEFHFVQSIIIPIAIHYIVKNREDFTNFLKICVFSYVGLVLVSFWFFLNPEVGRNLSKISVNSVDLYFPLLNGVLFFGVLFFTHFIKILRVRETFLFIFFIFFWESWFVFYNISPSYLSNWWGKKENIKNYLEYIEKLDSSYRICYFTGFPILFPGVKGIGMLNYYEPLINFDFVKFFNIWMNGSFLTPNDYFFILNNSILSLFSVKYIFVNNEFKERYDKYLSIGSLRSWDLQRLNSEKIVSKYENFSEIFENSQNLKVDSVNKLIVLKSNSRLVLNFRNELFNRMLLVTFKARVSKMNFIYKYRRLIFNLTDGLAIEIEDKNGRNLGYYFLNDYYLSDNQWNILLIPFFIDLREVDEFVNLKINIYPVNSFSRYYELRDVEVYSLPLIVPNFFDEQRNVYIFENRFMDYDVYINNQALPLIFSPERVVYYKNIGEIKYLHGTLNADVIGKNFMDTVFLPSDYRNYFKRDRFFKVNLKILEKRNNLIRVSYESRGEGLVIFNDLYYRGWIVKVNGQNNPILKANGLVKAVIVKAGKGTIEFRYEPFPFWMVYFNIFLIYFYGVMFILFLLLRSVGTSKILKDY